jgi:hypothetical protein
MLCLPRLRSSFFLPLICLVCFALAAPVRAQQQNDQEIIANLAAGKVIFWVARDAIIVGTQSQKLEPGSVAPIVLPLDTGHLAVLMGAVEWQRPGSTAQPMRLDQLVEDMHNLARKTLPNGATEQDEAGDIELFGIAFLDKLRSITSLIHHKLDLKPDEPLVELLLADFQPNYGPEVWRLSYRVKQTELRDDFWDTQAQRPAFEQLYPPEKKDPKVLVEFDYPVGGAHAQTMNDLLGQNDPRLVPIRSSDPKVGQAAQHVLDGASNKADSLAASKFLKGALQATAAPGSNLSLAVMYEDDRFTWVIAPPDEAKPGDAKRDADKPTLRRTPHQ